MTPGERVGTPRLLRAVADDPLQLQEVMDGPVGLFAAIAGLLVAAEGREGVPVRVVDVDLARPETPRHAAGMLQIPGLHIGGEA